MNKSGPIYGIKGLRTHPVLIATNKPVCKGVLASHKPSGLSRWGMEVQAGSELPFGLKAYSELTDGQSVLQAVPVIPCPI